MPTVFIVTKHHLLSLQACEIYLSSPMVDQSPWFLEELHPWVHCQDCTANVKHFGQMCHFFVVVCATGVCTLYLAGRVVPNLCQNLLKLFVGTPAIPTTLSAVVATKRWNLTLPPSWLAPTMVGTVFMASGSVKDGICYELLPFCHQNWSEAILAGLS